MSNPRPSGTGLMFRTRWDRSTTVALAGALLGLVAFVTIAAVWAGSSAPPYIDVATFQFVASWTGPVMTRALWGLTRLGDLSSAMFVATGLAVVLWRRDRGWTALAWLILFASGEGTLYILKWAFGRVRPSAPGILERAFSFPSGHAFTALLVYGTAFLVLTRRRPARRVRPALLLGTGLLILAIGWSRIVLHVHYLTDVLGGYALGLTWLAGAFLILHPPPARPTLSSSTSSRRLSDRTPGRRP